MTNRDLVFGRNRFPTLGLTLLLAVIVPLAIAAQEGEAAAPLAGPELVQRVSPAVVLILVGGTDDRLVGTASGVVIRPDGILLTAYHVVRDMRHVQVRLNNGETFDRVELLGYDARRDVAALRIPARGLAALPVVPPENVRVGEAVYVVSNPRQLTWSASSGILSAVRLADEVPGAGTGYRLLQFTAPVSPGSSGGVLVDARGRALGIVVGGLVTEQNLNFAVPIEAVLGLVEGPSGVALDAGDDLRLPAENRALQPDEIKESKPAELVKAARTVSIRTRDEHIPTDSLIDELVKREEFRSGALVLVQDEKVADLLVVLDHPLHLFDFTCVVTDRHTSMVLASVKVIAWDGIRAAPGLAKKLLAGLNTTQRAAVPELKRRPASESRQ